MKASAAPRGAVDAWRDGILVALLAASLVAYAFALAALSRELAADALARERTELISTAASIGVGALYLLAMLAPRALVGPRSAAALLVASFVARLIVSAAPPLLETDFQRYLWDGAVTSSGVNPYRHAPGSVLSGDVAGREAELLSALAARSRGVVASVNHAHLTTIYPPLAQLAFAAASEIEPFGIGGLRALFGVFDALTFLGIVGLLRQLSLPARRAIWYAANPLLLRETYSGLHMDVLVLPVLVGVAYCAVRGRSRLGALLCVVGSAVKVWPALLAPALLAPLRARAHTWVVASLGCLLVAAVLWSPVWFGRSDAPSGFGAYSASWQNNDGFFRAGVWLSERALELVGREACSAQVVMRSLSAVALVGVVLWQARGVRAEATDAPRRLLVVVGAAFLLSPTQFPWYWLWCLPLVVVKPSTPLLLYTALLPLYYVQDRWPAVHWIEHAPVWIGLSVAAVRRRQRREPTAIASASGRPAADVR